MIEFIKEKQNKHFSMHGIEISIKDEIVNGFSIKQIINQVLDLVPNHLFDNIDSIKVGQFEELQDRSLQAMYDNRTIYLTNTRKLEKEMVSDIIHEVAHSVEEQYRDFIFSDKKIEKEFLIKRKKLFDLLSRNGYERAEKEFYNLNYDRDFDMFLYKQVGYPELRALTTNLFYSPYAATSIREYFANAFEKFFIHHAPPRLKDISPKVYEKIIQISHNKQEREKYDFYRRS